MAHGYSARFAARIKYKHKKQPRNVVFQLGALCVKHEVPAVEVAEYLGITRQTFYYWMDETHVPESTMMESIVALVKKLKSHYETEK